MLHEAYALKCVVYRRLKQPPRPIRRCQVLRLRPARPLRPDCPNVEGSILFPATLLLLACRRTTTSPSLKGAAAASGEAGSHTRGRAPEVYDPARLEQLFGKLARHVPSEDDDATSTLIDI